MSQQLRGDLSPLEEQALIQGIAEREKLLRTARSRTEVRVVVVVIEDPICFVCFGE